MNRLAAALGLCLPVSIGLAQELTDQRANQIGEAYGQLMGMEYTMEYLSTTCGDGAGDLKAAWLRRNAQQDAQARTLFSRFLSQVEKQFGRDAAAEAESQLRKVLLEGQMQAVKQDFAQFTSRLASLPPEGKASTCRKLAASVDAGEWDVAKKNRALYEYLRKEVPEPQTP